MPRYRFKVKLNTVLLQQLRILERSAVRHVLQHVRGLYVWAACTVCVAMLLLRIIGQLVSTADLYAYQALNNSQRVVYHLASGELDGTPHYTKRATQQAPLDANTTFEGHEGLAAAPLNAITELTDKGAIPVIGHDGTVPWKYYARPYTPSQPRPIVAIIITNLGLSRPLTEDVFKLPHTVTLSFSPYASDANVWAKKARGEGFESLVDLPMEPSNFPMADPGPNGLLATLDGDTNSKRLHWTLSRFPGFVGLLATLSEKMTANLGAIRPVVTELTTRGVLFLYKKTPENAEFTAAAKSQNLLTLGVDTIIDEDVSSTMIVKQLDALAATAKQNGYAIGVAHSYPSTTREISLWMEALDKKGIDVAPLSAVAKKVFP